MDVRTERILIAFSRSGLRQIDVCKLTGIWCFGRLSKRI